MYHNLNNSFDYYFLFVTRGSIYMSVLREHSRTNERSFYFVVWAELLAANDLEKREIW